MLEVIRKDILRILSEAGRLLAEKAEDYSTQLKKLSDTTIHNASIFQDEDSVSIAVLVYSLSKIIERKEGSNPEIIILLAKAEKSLSEHELEEYNVGIKKLFDLIYRIDSKLNLYIEQVVNQAQIKKGSRLFYHGISSARAAEIMGISQWELLNYIGNTQIAEDEMSRASVKQRIAVAKKLFGVS